MTEVRVKTKEVHESLETLIFSLADFLEALQYYQRFLREWEDENG